MRKVLLLGTSGSIGSQSLDIFRADKKSFELVGFSLGKRVEQIPRILKDFPSVKHVCVQLEQDFLRLKETYPSLSWHYGDQGLIDIIKECGCDMVENALVGFSGLVPSVVSLQEKKILCLANKESLVVGGALINDLLSKGNGKLYPIDSEHVAIAKLLSSVKREDIEKILITGSGGSFRDYAREDLKNVTKEQALAHPTWSMGAKITIDSATMMNKGFEVLEAKWLFDFPLERTEILMHKESHVHSALLLKDGTYLADVSVPDMHGPIEYALYETKVRFELKHVSSLEELGPYHFWEFDPKRYPAPGIARRAYEQGGSACAVLNGANEQAVYAFLDGRLPFLSLESAVEAALEEIPVIENPTLTDLIDVDRKARSFVDAYCERR